MPSYGLLLRTVIAFAGAVTWVMPLPAEAGTAIGFSARMGDYVFRGYNDHPSVAVDAVGNVWIAGATSSATPPSSLGALQPVHNGGFCGGSNPYARHPCLDVFLQKRDPSGRVLYSTYLGGSNDDVPTAIAVDSDGNLYLLALTSSSNFPTTQDRLPVVFSSAVLVKMSPAGALLYSTYLPNPAVNAFALDRSGNVHLVGEAFPESPNTNPGGLPAKGVLDVWVGKLKMPEKRLEYAVTFGGSSYDPVTAIAVDLAGNAYVIGYTQSDDFPVTEGAFQMMAGTPLYSLPFVAKIDASGSRLLYSTFLGSNGDSAKAIAVDPAGAAYIAGRTRRTNFPVTPGAFQQATGGGDPPSGPIDAFVLKLNRAGSALAYSTYLGGSGYDEAASIVVDGEGNAYLTGSTTSPNFPLTNPAQPANRGFQDAFFVKLNSAGSALELSTYLGGMRDDMGTSVALGPGGEIYIGGISHSGNFPVTAFGPLVDTAFLTKLLPNTSAPPLRFTASVTNATFPVCCPDPQDISIAPGELITIFGNGIGPETPLGPQLDRTGRVATSLGETTVTFDGIAAPLLYVSASQVNAVAPYGLRGKTTARLQVRYAGFDSNPRDLKVAEAAPGLFAITPGSSLAAAMNEDGTLNSWDHPARDSSIVVLYATGAGLLDPAPVDGEISTAPYARIRFPVSVTVGGEQAEVFYAGAAPGLVSGAIQINVRLPTGIRTFVSPKSYSVQLRIGGYQSADTVRIVAE